jgi:hypothetical protein
MGGRQKTFMNIAMGKDPLSALYRLRMDLALVGSPQLHGKG